MARVFFYLSSVLWNLIWHGIHSALKWRITYLCCKMRETEKHREREWEVSENNEEEQLQKANALSPLCSFSFPIFSIAPDLNEYHGRPSYSGTQAVRHHSPRMGGRRDTENTTQQQWLDESMHKHTLTLGSMQLFFKGIVRRNSFFWPDAVQHNRCFCATVCYLGRMKHSMKTPSGKEKSQMSFL